MISSDKFQFTRLMLLAKREIISNKKLYIMQLATLAGIIILGEFLISWISYPSVKDANEYFNSFTHSSYYNSDNAVIYITVAGLMAFSFISTVSASLVCSRLNNKKGRIDNYMTVGTPAEKYFLKLFIHTAAYMIVFFVIWLVTDLVRCLYIDAFYPFNSVSVVKFIIKNMEWEPALVFTSGFFFSQAYYVLVSAFSPKWAFLKGFGISYAVSILMVPASILFVWIAGDCYPKSEYVSLLASAILLCFTAAMHRLAYYRYNETDII